MLTPYNGRKRMKKTFWLLDVNYEVRDHQPEMWIWGIDAGGDHVLIIDRNFLSYFYLMVDEKENPQIVVDRIKARRADFPFLVRAEPVVRSSFGKPVRVIKIVCQDPDLMQSYAKRLSKIKGVKRCFEDGIRYSMRYLIDNDVTPCSWHEVEAEETENALGIQIDKVYLAKSFPKNLEKPEVPQLRILGFSMICYSPKGSPKPQKNPVVVISAATNASHEKQFIAKDSDDKPLMGSFVKHVRDFDPDVIIGYGTNRQDWHYLLFRSRKCEPIC